VSFEMHHQFSVFGKENVFKKMYHVRKTSDW